MTGQVDPTLQARQAAEAAVVSRDTVYQDWNIDGNRSTTMTLETAGQFLDGQQLADTLAANKNGVAIIRAEDPSDPNNRGKDQYFSYGRDGMVHLRGFDPFNAGAYKVPEGGREIITSESQALKQPHSLGPNLLLPGGRGQRIKAVTVSTELFGTGLFRNVTTAIATQPRKAHMSDLLSGRSEPDVISRRYTTPAGSITERLRSASNNADPTKVHNETQNKLAEKRTKAAQAAGTVAVGRR